MNSSGSQRMLSMGGRVCLQKKALETACPAAELITRYMLKWWLLFKIFRISFLFFDSSIHTYMLFGSNNSPITSLHLLPCSQHPLPFLDPLWAACMFVSVGPLTTVSVASLGLYPWRKLTLTASGSSVRGGSSWLPPLSTLGFGSTWSCAGILHTVPASVCSCPAQ